MRPRLVLTAALFVPLTYAAALPIAYILIGARIIGSIAWDAWT